MTSFTEDILDGSTRNVIREYIQNSRKFGELQPMENQITNGNVQGLMTPEEFEKRLKAEQPAVAEAIKFIAKIKLDSLFRSYYFLVEGKVLLLPFIRYEAEKNLLALQHPTDPTIYTIADPTKVLPAGAFPSYLYSEKAYTKYQEEKILEEQNNYRERRYRDHISELNNINNSLKDFEKAVERNKAHKLFLEKKIKEGVPPPFTITSLKRKLAEIKKHILVSSVYVGKEYTIVRTKPLIIKNPYPDDIKGGKVNLGAFVIFILKNGGVEIRNESFMYDGEHDHPNIQNGYVCWGNMEQPVLDFSRAEAYFELIDLAIDFLITYPQDSTANPYVDYLEWLQDREEITYSRVDTKWMIKI